MNVVREINKINELELQLGASGASWHDEYKDSAYIFVGGLNFELTEGDVITIFSQYGEVMDVNLPRDKQTGKPRGFGFLMYEDQRSTVLAVDNLNGAEVLGKILRVDHVKNYKQPKMKGEDGEWEEPEEQSLNAKPQLIEDDGAESESSATLGASIDPEDPMRDFLLAKRREEMAKNKIKKSKHGKGKHKDETPEERRARKERKKEKKLRKKAGKSDGVKGVEALLGSLGVRNRDPERRSRSPVPVGESARTRTPPRRTARSRSRSPVGDRSRRSRSPPRRTRRSPVGDRPRRSGSRPNSPPQSDYRMRGVRLHDDESGERFEISRSRRN